MIPRATVNCRLSTVNLFLLLLPLVAIACSRDQADLVTVREPPGGPAMRGLAPTDLRTHADFDRLDASLSRAAPGDALKVYDDLARVAPDDRLVLFRGAFAGLTVDGTDRGKSVALGVRGRLEAKFPDDPDVKYLGILLDRSTVAGNAAAPSLDASRVDAAKALAARAEAFVAAHPDWTGPAGLKTDAVARLGRELTDAVARLQPSPTPDAGTP